MPVLCFGKELKLKICMQLVRGSAGPARTDPVHGPYTYVGCVREQDHSSHRLKFVFFVKARCVKVTRLSQSCILSYYDFHGRKLAVFGNSGPHKTLSALSAEI